MMEGLSLVTGNTINKCIYGPIYPCWTQKLIKRKYGNNPNVYLDVWLPYRKSPFDYLPKQQWDGYRVKEEKNNGKISNTDM